MSMRGPLSYLMIRRLGKCGRKGSGTFATGPHRGDGRSPNRLIVHHSKSNCQIKSRLLQLCDQKFDHPAHQIVLAENRHAIEEARVRLERLTKLVADTVPSLSMAPLVQAYQATRGVSLMAAVIFAVEIGDVRRFDNPRQLMAYLGLVPSESSIGDRVQRGAITKAGNNRARRALIEGAWTNHFPARMSRLMQGGQESLPKIVREIAWKGQVRLCVRYRKLTAAGKLRAVTVTAIAREMAAFLWAIGHEVTPVPGA